MGKQLVRHTFLSTPSEQILACYIPQSYIPSWPGNKHSNSKADTEQLNKRTNV
jgi:hypothetical protein